VFIGWVRLFAQVVRGDGGLRIARRYRFCLDAIDPEKEVGIGGMPRGVKLWQRRAAHRGDAGAIRTLCASQSMSTTRRASGRLARWTTAAPTPTPITTATTISGGVTSDRGFISGTSNAATRLDAARELVRAATIFTPLVVPVPPLVAHTHMHSDQV
jgi:hypothetical protein